MDITLKDLIISSKEFSSEELRINNYSIFEVGKMKAGSESFRSKAEFTFSPDHLTDAIENGGKVYAYKKKNSIKALYIVRKTEDSFTCDEYFYSPDIAEMPITKLMDQKVAFLMAHRATSKNTKAIFKGIELPRLTQTKGGYSWSMAVTFAIIYTFVFANTAASESRLTIGLGTGIALGAMMGECFRSRKYIYEGVKDEKTD